MPQDQFLTKYFTIVSKPKMYLTLLYLFLAFPLGLAYFGLLVVGFSLGFSLLIIWVGIIILALLFPTIWLLISFERLQTSHLLGMPIPIITPVTSENTSLWQKLKSFLTDPTTWKGILFILMKFPIGIISFLLLVTGFAVLSAMIFSPLIVSWQWSPINFGLWRVDTISEAIGLCILGLMALPGVFHFYFYLSQMIGKLSEFLLKPNAKSQV
ncbi:MAG: hypothetical protein CVU40_05630 [Chloroflexi bacterium HGW-Chloroflexi-2]|nr:MAG: hypothetical protein CVU40_05630 [Chloroflexi bacterium HGW-Chloroflexi-2]